MRDTLRGFITDEILNRPDFVLGDEDDLLTSGLVDSLGVVSLVNFIEEETGLDVPPEDVTLENFLSIRAIDAYVSSLREAT